MILFLNFIVNLPSNDPLLVQVQRSFCAALAKEVINNQLYDQSQSSFSLKEDNSQIINFSSKVTMINPNYLKFKLT